jgi:hypothetical protein
MDEVARMARIVRGPEHLDLEARKAIAMRGEPKPLQHHRDKAAISGRALRALHRHDERIGSLIRVAQMNTDCPDMGRVERLPVDEDAFDKGPRTFADGKKLM